MDKKKAKALPEKAGRRKPFPIVAIGASAGGLEAITALLKALSPKTGMAFICVQHLDPNYKSLLSSLLQRVTKMKVHEAEDLMRIESDTVYVIPPGKDLFVIDGVLATENRPVGPNVNMSINHFFSSLAVKHKDGCIGVLLSGNGSDGTLGLQAIKNSGGITFAQDASAKFPAYGEVFTN